jgi:hypothetical protein
MTLEKEQDGVEEEKSKPIQQWYKPTVLDLLNERARFDNGVSKTQPRFALTGGSGHSDLVGFWCSIRLSGLHQWAAEG